MWLVWRIGRLWMSGLVVDVDQDKLKSGRMTLLDKLRRWRQPELRGYRLHCLCLPREMTVVWISKPWHFVQPTCRQGYVRFAKQQMSKPASPDSQNPVTAILEHSSNMSSWKLTAMAVRSNIDIKSVQRDYRRASEALLQSSSLLWQMTFQRILDMLSNENFEGLVLIRKRRYDESPFRLRLREETDGGIALASAQAVGAAKVMQSQLEFAALIRRKAPNDEYMYQEIHGEALAWLHVVDKTTAENIAETQRQIQCSVKLPDHIEDKFKLVCDVVCTDRYTANIAAERSLQSGLTGWVKSHHYCLLHKAATIQAAQFKLVGGHVSGLLSVALSMHASGTSALLKELLSQLLSQKLVVRHASPPVHFRHHQEALHDLFLPIAADSKSASLRKRQRIILSALMNGDLQDEGQVSYYTEDSSITKAMIEAVWVRFAVSALLATQVPQFQPFQVVRWGTVHRMVWAPQLTPQFARAIGAAVGFTYVLHSRGGCLHVSSSSQRMWDKQAGTGWQTEWLPCTAMLPAAMMVS